MNNSHLLAALLLASPLAATAQTKPAAVPAPAPGAATQQVTEVTEDLDPATGKVIRRTTRTTTAPAGAPAAGTAATPVFAAKATDAQVSAFVGRKTTVSALSAPALLDAYNRFIEKVRLDRRAWRPADWSAASAVLGSLNGRYDQLRASLTLDDKVTIRSQQAEFQALLTARQLSDQVSNKL